MTTDFSIEFEDAWENRVQLGSRSEILAFLEGEIDAWKWIDEAPHTLARVTISPAATLATAKGWLSNVDDGTWQPHVFSNNLGQRYNIEPQNLLLSDVVPGANVLLIKEMLGKDHGELAFAMLTGQTRPDIRENLKAFRVWQLLANPSLIDSEVWLSDHRKKLAATRAALRGEVANLRRNEEERQALFAETSVRQRARYRRILALYGRVAGRRARRIGDSASAAIASIEATERAYSLQMGLEAPVRYWRAKQRIHSRAAVTWGIALLLYAVIAIVGSCIALPALWEALPTGEALTGRHFILVAALGAALTTVFWAARVLVRIFLAERHLATDAEERRIMTQAYLALMKGDAASNEERSIILSALFRKAQDGIVRDEGVGDVGVPALLARLLDGRK